MKKWVLSFCLSLITLPICSGDVWASSSDLVVLEEEQIDCEKLDLIEFSEEEQRYLNDELDDDWINKWILETMDGERYIGTLYAYTFYDITDESNIILFSPAGIPLQDSRLRCPDDIISQENALLIIGQCSDRE
ncbi:MAG: hypothetical protein J7647_19485 [Cyanobacteria bacterium SBLK]|nr:hypothetical protein [Cyanobacteria bacterium SBLK]